MVNKKASIKLAERWDSADRWVKRVLGLIATAGTIIGLMTGTASWILSQLDTRLDTKIYALSQEIEDLGDKSDAGDKKLELSNTRLELNILITHTPTNTVEIERVAKYYFVELGGDWYMSKIYSDWAREYGGDTSFVMHKD